jgi:hypothetical protein
MCSVCVAGDANTSVQAQLCLLCHSVFPGVMSHLKSAFQTATIQTLQKPNDAPAVCVMLRSA